MPLFVDRRRRLRTLSTKIPLLVDRMKKDRRNPALDISKVIV